MPRKLEESDRAEPLLEARSLRIERLLIPKDAATILRLSPSWLAKARMRGDGPPFAKLGRAIRYPEDSLVQWMKSRLRLTTSQR